MNILLARALLSIGQIYAWFIFGYCILTWFPTNEGLIADIRAALGKIVEPFLGLFRKIIPPIGGMVDITPIIAFFVLQFAIRILVTILV